MLQHRFIDSVRKNPNKVAFNDRATDRVVSYKQALLGTLILARRFKELERGRIGIMMPTSSGGALAITGALFAGLTPVMINYSTGAEKNCRYAQQQCDFEVIITARALLEKTGCEQVPGMVFIEDIMASLTALEKTIAFTKSNLPTALLKRISGSQDLDRAAVILFTSGSEKDPKVVQLSQKNILSNIDAFCAMMDVYGMDNLSLIHI